MTFDYSNRKLKVLVGNLDVWMETNHITILSMKLSWQLQQGRLVRVRSLTLIHLAEYTGNKLLDKIRYYGALFKSRNK